MINSNLLEKHILLAKKQEKERILKIIDKYIKNNEEEGKETGHWVIIELNSLKEEVEK